MRVPAVSKSSYAQSYWEEEEGGMDVGDPCRVALCFPGQPGGDRLVSLLLVFLPLAGDLPRGAGGRRPGPCVLPEGERTFFCVLHQHPTPSRNDRGWGAK